MTVPAIFLQPLPFILLAGFVGLCVGSFLNVVAHRLPLMMQRDWDIEVAEMRGEPLPTEPVVNLVTPRSRCPHCGHPLTALENIPVLSWLLLGGKCSACKGSISARYPLVELFTCAASCLVAWRFGPSLAALGALAFTWAMIALAAIDLDTTLLPDSITLPLLWLGLLLNIQATYTDLTSAVVGAVAGYMALWLVHHSFRLLTGKIGMGHGDFKLLGAIGAWLGWKMLPLTILFSSLVGAVVGVILIVVAKHGRDVPIPFGPYLAAAGLLALLWGQEITNAYLRTL